MTVDEFATSLTAGAPPEGLPPALLGLWHAGRGEWTKAHEIVQDDDGRDAAWVHAWLHRDEGDTWNAGYWYRRAGRPHHSGALNEEWREIAEGLLGCPLKLLGLRIS
ncbi:hypothetical protein GGD81_004633 [Rhodobium orientis]|uniref:Uncharacterized protein n=1 Tax=Rhodobium orientis TaxID=34017 RepID=A0A327JE38_9HYPH|nr:hypothetical protein [Rhodobium orientis]MBB4305553.1 hypothetical protein [Rhodobium orientis]MBK5949148.1 hypothetical protein [Rhodobium orientis]RAI24690.1 hypothetical protein CH339_21705 [Rhodobium orientis]